MGYAELTVDKGPNLKEISYHGVDVGVLPEGPRHCGCVVAPSERGAPGWGDINKRKGCFLKDEGGEFQVRICNVIVGVRKTNQICPDVSGTRQAPHVIEVILIRVNPHDPPPSQSGGISKANVSGQALHNLCQVSWTGRNLGAQLLPKGDVRVEHLGEVGGGAGDVVDGREGALDVVEVAHCAGDRQVHRAKFANKALQLFCGHAVLGGCDIQESGKFGQALWGEGESVFFGVHEPAQDFL